MSKNTTTHYSPYLVMNWIADAPLKARQKAVLLALARFMSKKNGYRVWPSQKLLAEKAGMCENTLREQLKVLSDLQYVLFKKVPCKKGSYRYEYTLYLPSTFKGSKPQVLTSGPSILEHKGDKPNELDVGNVELCSKGTTPSASAFKDSEKQKDNRDGEALVQDFKKNCKHDQSSRLRFYMECGRLHTEADHFHNPKNPDKPLTFCQVDSLRIWFNQLPESGCAVMNYAMANWSRLLDGIPTWRHFRNKTPTISALEKYGVRALFEAWRDSQHQAVLKHVEQHFSPITDEYYLR